MSATLSVAVLIVVVVPETVKLPETVRLLEIVTLAGRLNVTEPVDALAVI